MKTQKKNTFAIVLKSKSPDNLNLRAITFKILNLVIL